MDKLAFWWLQLYRIWEVCSNDFYLLEELDGTYFNTLIYRNCFKAFYSKYYNEGEGTDIIKSPINNLIELLECDDPNS